MTKIGSKEIWIPLPSKRCIIRRLVRHELFKFKGEIKEVYIIGSFCRGNPHKDSDVDVLLFINNQIGHTDDTFTEKQRLPLRNYFVRNNINGKADHIHPRYADRRIDIYFTFQERKSDCIKLK